MARIRTISSALLLVLAGAAVLATTADATPRRIAVVNVAEDQEAGAQLATRLRTMLALEPTVTPIPPGDLARALEGAARPLATSAADLAAAADHLARGREALAQFDYQGALARLADAEQLLLAAWPSPASTRLLADIALERGRIYMRQKQPERALQELVLVHRLDPGRQLEPERYLPDVIEAFARAVTLEQGMAPSVTLEVPAVLDGVAVHVDGQPAGHTPVTMRVTPDAHYVSGTFAGRAVSGTRIVADRARGRAAIKLHLGTITPDESALHWRREHVQRAATPPGPDLAAEIGRGAVAFTGAEAVLIIATGVGGALHIASYDARTREPGDWELAGERALARALAPFTDTRTPMLDDTTLRRPPLLGDRDVPPWHRRRLYRGLLNSGIAVSVAAVVFYAVLQGSDTIGGTCCTFGISGGVSGIVSGIVSNRPHSFGFSF